MTLWDGTKSHQAGWCLACDTTRGWGCIFLCDIGLSKEGSYRLDIFCLAGLSSLLT